MSSLITRANPTHRSWTLDPVVVQVAFVLCAVAMRIASTPSANLSFVLLGGYALLGRAQAIQALALSWLFSMLGAGVAAEATASAIGRYAVLAGAVASVLMRSVRMGRNFRIGPVNLATLLLGALVLVHSVLFSAMVDVSVLKVVSWTLVMTTLTAAWLGLKAKERETTSRQIFGGLIVVMLLSLPLLASPLGYLRNETGFQGVLNHPQAFGPTMALLGAWAASRMFAEKRPPWLVLGLVPACFVLCVLSEARIAGLSLLIGVAISVVAAPLLYGRSGSIMAGLHSDRVKLVVLLLLTLGMSFSSLVTERIQSFITKRSDAVTVGEAYDNSRGYMLDRMLTNIYEKPLVGIGFGISSELWQMDVVRDEIFGLPVSAPVEKGVLPVAVLEELGLIGLFGVAVWIWQLLRRIARAGITPLCVSITSLLLNMGESTLFSPGGLGLLSLILLSWACSCGELRGRR